MIQFITCDSLFIITTNNKAIINLSSFILNINSIWGTHQAPNITITATVNNIVFPFARSLAEYMFHKRHWIVQCLWMCETFTTFAKNMIFTAFRCKNMLFEFQSRMSCRLPRSLNTNEEVKIHSLFTSLKWCISSNTSVFWIFLQVKAKMILYLLVQWMCDGLQPSKYTVLWSSETERIHSVHE